MADFVVKFARDGAALGFLGVDEARGELLQLGAAVDEFGVAETGLALETQDVDGADDGEKKPEMSASIRNSLRLFCRRPNSTKLACFAAMVS